MPKALQCKGSPDHNAIIAESYKSWEDGTEVVCVFEFHSSLEHGRESPRASTAVTTGGDAKTNVIIPDNKYIQKYVLE